MKDITVEACWGKKKSTEMKEKNRKRKERWRIYLEEWIR